MGFHFVVTKRAGGTGLATFCRVLEPLVGEGGGGGSHEGAELPQMGLAPGFISCHLLRLLKHLSWCD